MPSNIHPTAVIEGDVELAKDVTIGPYCLIKGNIKIGSGTKLLSHVVVLGNTFIGEGNILYPFASIGAPPQSLRYKGEPSQLKIGNCNIIREYVTIQPGTEIGGMETIIGSNNLFMAGSHVAHDCKVGDGNILANNVGLSGHVEVHNCVVLGGLSGVHQFCKIGSFSFIAGGAMVRQDVPPFCSVHGDSAEAYGLNLVGLKRNNFSAEEIVLIKKIFKIFYLSGKLLEERIQLIKALVKEPDEKQSQIVSMFLHFIENSQRGVVRYVRKK